MMIDRRASIAPDDARPHPMQTDPRPHPIRFGGRSTGGPRSTKDGIHRRRVNQSIIPKQASTPSPGPPHQRRRPVLARVRSRDGDDEAAAKPPRPPSPETFDPTKTTGAPPATTRPRRRWNPSLHRATLRWRRRRPRGASSDAAGNSGDRSCGRALLAIAPLQPPPVLAAAAVGTTRGGRGARGAMAGGRQERWARPGLVAGGLESWSLDRLLGRLSGSCTSVCGWGGRRRADPAAVLASWARRGADGRLQTPLWGRWIDRGRPSARQRRGRTPRPHGALRLRPPWSLI